MSKLILVGIFTIGFGVFLALWPNKYQEFNVRPMQGRSGFFVDAWKSKATTVTIRLIGVGAVIMGSLALAKAFNAVG